MEQQDSLIGHEIDGRYRIVGLLGVGGMGSVYEAEHLALGKRVAIKVIRASLVANEEARARFEREARATAQIEHQHITTGMDFGRLPDGAAYLVVQLVRGTSLHERIEEGPIGWREACVIGAQIADALVAIHAAGFVHRDLTPGNVLVARREDGSPHVHVLDLGVASLTAEISEDQRLTEAGRVVGTTGYMAPEQALGQRVDGRADLYSLGVVLWEMCAGARLRNEASLTQALAAQLTESVPPIPQLSAGTAPRALEALITALLESERDQRPPNALEVRDRLVALQNQGPDPKPKPELPWPLIGLAGGALALAIATVSFTSVAVWALWPSDPPPVVQAPPPPPVVHTTSVVAPPVTTSPQIERMLNGRYRDDRRDAAEALLADPRTPAWAAASARLTLATSCQDRRSALRQITHEAHEEALPVVERMAAAPRDGCGRGRRSDCYACVREDLDRARAALSPRPIAN